MRHQNLYLATALLLTSALLVATPQAQGASQVRGDPAVEVATLPGGADAGDTALLRQSGSIAKYVCTLAAVRLENAGLLSLDSPVSELLPSYRGAPDPDLTLRRLLENRSGLEDGLSPALSQDRGLLTAAIPSAEAANRFSVARSPVPPGQAFSYVNSNWVLVQAILEQATGQDLAVVIDEWVLTPAGADGAHIFTGQLDGPGTARAEGSPTPVPDFVSCAGGLAARPADLLAISAFPFTSSLFDDADRADLLHVSTPDEAYTMGGRFEWVRDRDGAVRRISWQTGSNGPWYASAIYDPETGHGFAAMTASSRDELNALQDAWLAGQGLERLDRDAGVDH